METKKFWSLSFPTLLSICLHKFNFFSRPSKVFSFQEGKLWKLSKLISAPNFLFSPSLHHLEDEADEKARINSYAQHFWVKTDAESTCLKAVFDYASTCEQEKRSQVSYQAIVSRMNWLLLFLFTLKDTHDSTSESENSLWSSVPFKVARINWSLPGRPTISKPIYIKVTFCGKFHGLVEWAE